MKLFSGKRLKLVFSSLLSVLVSGSLWTCSISASDETLPTVTRTRFSTGITSIDNLDVEYTVTGGLVESIHIDTPSFTVTDGSSNGYHINSGNIKLKTENGLIKNYANVSIIPNSGNIWTVQANGIDVNGNDISYTAQVENLHVSYEIVQHIFIGFNTPVYGSCSVGYSLNTGRSIHAIKFPKLNNAAYSTYTHSTRSGVFTFFSYGEPTISVDFVEYHYNETSFPSLQYSPMAVVDKSTWSYGDLIAYEEPVKDIGSHNLLQRILDAILNTNDNGAAQQQVNEIKDTAENKMGGITDATELVEQGFENLQGDAVNKLTFPGLFGGDSWSLDLGYIEQQAPELVAIMRTLLIAAVAWGCYEMLKNTVLGNSV